MFYFIYINLIMFKPINNYTNWDDYLNCLSWKNIN